ncbi:MAG: hypothetical protein GXP49_08320 [Deltaproteobacteria bacterium]|nr:hypothetical protein [Deltaproteobacteria bacterium]
MKSGPFDYRGFSPPAVHMAATRSRLSPTASGIWPRLRLPAAVLALLSWIGGSFAVARLGMDGRAFELPKVKRGLKQGQTTYIAVYNGKKVGSTTTSIEALEPGSNDKTKTSGRGRGRELAGNPGWRIFNRTRLSGIPLLESMDAETEITLGRDMGIHHLESRIDTAMGELVVKGESVSGNKLKLDISIGHRSFFTTINKAAFPTISDIFLQSISLRDLVPGRIYQVPLLDLGTGTRLKASVELRDVEPKPDGRLFHLLLRYGDGPELRAQVNEYGEVLMQELPYGVTLVKAGARSEKPVNKPVNGKLPTR